jgi:hypothetical protein
MGTYYRVACPELREWIAPSQIRERDPTLIGGWIGGGIKWHAVVSGPTAHAVMALIMPGGRWADKAVLVIPDGGDKYYELDEPTWTNVTREAVEAIDNPAFKCIPE